MLKIAYDAFALIVFSLSILFAAVVLSEVLSEILWRSL